MAATDDRAIDVKGLKAAVREAAKKVNEESDFDPLEAELFKQFSAEPLAEKKPDDGGEKPAEETPPTDATDAKTDDDKKDKK